MYEIYNRRKSLKTSSSDFPNCKSRRNIVCRQYVVNYVSSTDHAVGGNFELEVKIFVSFKFGRRGSN